MNPATPPGDKISRAKRFAAVVVPAAKRAGYDGFGAGAQLARDTGLSDSTISRMLKGQSLPVPAAWGPIARQIGMTVHDLMVEAELISPESLQALSETDQSQVRSRSITPEEAADGLGLTDSMAREMFFATYERLKRIQDEASAENAEDSGGAQAQ